MDIETDILSREKLESLLDSYHRAFVAISDSKNVLIEKLSPILATRTSIDGNDLIVIVNEWLAEFVAAVQEAALEIWAIETLREPPNRVN